MSVIYCFRGEHHVDTDFVGSETIKDEEVCENCLTDLEAQGPIEVGDVVRSFDFAMGEFGRELEGDRASYIEGVVIAIGDSPACAANCPHYHIEVGREVSGGLENFHRGNLLGEIVYPPLTDDRGNVVVEIIPQRRPA